MKNIITIIIAVVASLAATHYLSVQTSSVSAQKSIYQTVMERGTLRCGYFEEPPFTFKDPNTGTMSGIAVELAEMIATDLEIKLEWAEPISFGTFVTDLANRRYDAICGSIFVLPRAGKLDFTVSYATVPLYGYVRPENKDFDKPFNSIDWSQVKVSAIDGEGATTITRKLLPQAQLIALPQTALIADMLLSVAQSKADIGFVMPGVFREFDKSNPGMLRQAQLDKPLYRFSVAFGLRPEEQGLKNMIDNRIRQYIANGELDRLFTKYDPDNNLIKPQP